MKHQNSGNPDLRWFDQLGQCVCGKPATGVLRGVGNASYGKRCRPCAERELKAADDARARGTALRREMEDRLRPYHEPRSYEDRDDHGLRVHGLREEDLP